jgi:hypothetical protein
MTDFYYFLIVDAYENCILSHDLNAIDRKRIATFIIMFAFLIIELHDIKCLVIVSVNNTLEASQAKVWMNQHNLHYDNSC